MAQPIATRQIHCTNLLRQNPTEVSFTRDVISDALKRSLEEELSIPDSRFTYHNPSDFIRDFHELFPHSDFLEKHFICENPRYDPHTLYFSSNVSYLEYSEKLCKTNTFTLCPFCDPWVTGIAAKKNKNKKKAGQDEVKFFDTLNCQFSHHMFQVHGVCKQRGRIRNPFVGFTHLPRAPLENEPDFRLSIICPYPISKSKKPCLELYHANSYFPGGSGTFLSLKSYFRHVEKYHPCGRSVGTYKQYMVYERFVNSRQDRKFLNFLLPVNIERFQEAILQLMNECSLKEPPISLPKYLDGFNLEGLPFKYPKIEPLNEDCDHFIKRRQIDPVMAPFVPGGRNDSKINSRNSLLNPKETKAIDISIWSPNTEKDEMQSSFEEPVNDLASIKPLLILPSFADLINPMPDEEIKFDFVPNVTIDPKAWFDFKSLSGKETNQDVPSNKFISDNTIDCSQHDVFLGSSDKPNSNDGDDFFSSIPQKMDLPLPLLMDDKAHNKAGFAIIREDMDAFLETEMNWFTGYGSPARSAGASDFFAFECE